MCVENMKHEKHGCFGAYDNKINPFKNRNFLRFCNKVLFLFLGEKLQFFALQPATHEPFDLSAVFIHMHSLPKSSPHRSIALAVMPASWPHGSGFQRRERKSQ